MDKKLLDLYSDYLISANQLTTATGLSDVLDNEISHDKITRFLSKETFGSADLWKLVKPTVRKHESNKGGVLIFDDTVQEKAYTDENDIISWHYSHALGKVVKGLNILSSIVTYDGVTFPVGFEVIKKDIKYCDLFTCQEKKTSSKSKNELFRSMYKVNLINVKFDYVLFDSWFSAKENLEIIHKSKKIFIAGVKSNRTIATSLENKMKGKFIQINQLSSLDSNPIEVYLKGIEFPMKLMKKVFKNEDGSKGILYLITNEMKKDGEQIYEIYQKRWKIEVYHKSIKSNAALKKSPTKTVRTQTNHIFSSIYAYFKLEIIGLATGLNHFALKYKIIVKANIASMKELQRLASFT
jgi:IS4 transposase